MTTFKVLNHSEDVSDADYNLPVNDQPRLNRYYFGVTLDHSDSEPIDFTFYCETLTAAWVELAQHLAVLGYKAVKMALWEADGE